MRKICISTFILLLILTKSFSIELLLTKERLISTEWSDFEIPNFGNHIIFYENNLFEIISYVGTRYIKSEYEIKDNYLILNFKKNEYIKKNEKIKFVLKKIYNSPFTSYILEGEDNTIYWDKLSLPNVGSEIYIENIKALTIQNKKVMTKKNAKIFTLPDVKSKNYTYSFYDNKNKEIIMESLPEKSYVTIVAKIEIYHNKKKIIWYYCYINFELYSSSAYLDKERFLYAEGWIQKDFIFLYD